jgi:hypothetical protein
MCAGVQRMGIIAPVRPVKCDAMPLNASAAKSCKAKPVTFYDDTTVLSKSVQHFDKAKHVAMPLEQSPIEPTNLRVSAGCPE